MKPKPTIRQVVDGFRRHQRWIVAVLIATLAALVAALIFQHAAIVAAAVRQDSATIAKLAAVLKESVYAVGVLAAGGWTYYLFARGRTFSPRLAVDLEFTLPQPVARGVDVLRIRVQNVGNVKVTLKTLEVSLLLGELQSGQFTFKQFAHIPDILIDNYPAWAGFRLEPKDQMILDVPVYSPVIASGLNEDHQGDLIKVVAILTDFADRLWKEQRILPARR